MKNILNNIILLKQQEVNEKKKMKLFFSEAELFSKTSALSLVKKLRSPIINIIAEFKRKSPSGFKLTDETTLQDIISLYVSNGAAGISVLTDSAYFGGSLNDLKFVSERSDLPVLRKEFIIDEFQVYESKAAGADVILLIAGILQPSEVKRFSSVARQLSMEVLLEIRNQKELEEYYCNDVDIIGVNNRNLDTLETNISTSLYLADKIPSGVIKISESGIENGRQIAELRESGYNGFLIGHSLLKKQDPGFALKELIQSSKMNIYEN